MSGVDDGVCNVNKFSTKGKSCLFENLVGGLSENEFDYNKNKEINITLHRTSPQTLSTWWYFMYIHGGGGCYMSKNEWMEIVYNNNSVGSYSADDIRIQNVLLFINIHLSMTFLYPVTKSNTMIKIQFVLPRYVWGKSLFWCWLNFMSEIWDKVSDKVKYHNFQDNK